MDLDSKRDRDNKRLKQRRLPTQKRSVERTQQIFETTAKLLERVGIDDLTTILIARELGISVGALYHYFPNKHAILHGLGARWLDEMTVALEHLETQLLEQMTIKQFVDIAVEQLLCVYRDQRALLPLMQVMSSIPELRELDQVHDRMIISKLTTLFKRLGVSGASRSLERKSWGYLEMTHAMFLLVVDASVATQAALVSDIKRMAVALLEDVEPS